MATTYSGMGNGFHQYRGLSADDKPTNAKNGDIFIEIDTATIYMYDGEGEEWVMFMAL